jgi:hypothetical protein
MKTIRIVIGVLILTGLAATAILVLAVQDVEQPAYETLVQDDPFELRDYPRVMLEVERGPSSRGGRPG